MFILQMGAACAIFTQFLKRGSSDRFDKNFFHFTIQPINYSTNQLSLQGEASKIAFKYLN